MFDSYLPAVECIGTLFIGECKCFSCFLFAYGHCISLTWMYFTNNALNN